MDQQPVSAAPHPDLPKYYARTSEREAFVRTLFDEGAPFYDWILGVLSFGTGDRHRRETLERAGLTRDMRMLDVASGTGAVARCAATLRGGTAGIIALDPSIGMLMAGRKRAQFSAVQSVGEHLPLPAASVDFISVGFAMRHFSDLRIAFAEFKRVLRPGGRLLIMEITAPRSAIARGMLGLYMGGIIPTFVRLRTGSVAAKKMMDYYWDTTRSCVPPEQIVETMRSVGFRDVRRDVDLSIFSAYCGTS